MNNMTENICRKFKLSISDFIAKTMSGNYELLANHIAGCPRCQKRLARMNKVFIAMDLIKAQPHKMDLLARANTKAINVLCHSLQNEPQAQQLKNAVPKIGFALRYSGPIHSIANLAACLAVLFLIKTGIFNSMQNFHNEGSKSISKYYENRLGADLYKEIIKKSSES